jgi:hypothetical protein
MPLTSSFTAQPLGIPNTSFQEGSTGFENFSNKSINWGNAGLNPDWGHGQDLFAEYSPLPLITGLSNPYSGSPSNSWFGTFKSGMDFPDLLEYLKSQQKSYSGEEYRRKAYILQEVGRHLEQRLPQDKGVVDTALIEAFKVDDAPWEFLQTTGAIAEITSIDFNAVHEMITAAEKKYPSGLGLSFGLDIGLGFFFAPLIREPVSGVQVLGPAEETAPKECPPWPQHNLFGIKWNDSTPAPGWYKLEVDTAKGPVEVCAKVTYVIKPPDLTVHNPRIFEFRKFVTKSDEK